MHPNDVAYNVSGQWSSGSYSWLPRGKSGNGHSHSPGEQCSGHGHSHGQGHGHGHGHGHGGNFTNYLGPKMAWNATNLDDYDDEEEKVYPKPVGDFSTRINFINVPILGRLQFLNDSRGIMQVSFIVFYWIYGMWFNYIILLLPHYRENHISLIPLIVFFIFSTNCIISLFRASTTNPGRIPYSEDKYPVPSDDAEWTFCKRCQRKRPPNSHHCSRCQHCTVGMDHHCPWINNCVGEDNHYLFILLLVYAAAMSCTSVIFICCHFFYWPELQLKDMTSFPFSYEKGFIIAGVIMSSLMSLAMMGLCGSQHLGIVTGLTTIDMMKFKTEIEASGEIFTPAKFSHLMKPWIPSYRGICGKGSISLWLVPCRRRSAATQNNRYVV